MTNMITINVIDPLYRHHRLYGYRYHTHHQYTVKGHIYSSLSIWRRLRALF